MKKLMKRTGAILMAIAMMAALAVSAWAAPNDVNATANITGVPSANDQGVVKITGLNKGDVVNFYQIVDAKYDANGGGFRGYQALYDDTSGSTTVAAANIKLYDKNNKGIYPSAAQIADLLGKVSTMQAPTGAVATTPTTVPATGPEVTATLDVGEWLAVVTPAEIDATNGVDKNRVYNPMVLSVYYTNNGSVVTSGKVDAKDGWEINGQIGAVKSTDVTTEKKIDSTTLNDIQTTNKNGDDVAVGDDINFHISTIVPAYSNKYSNIKFEVFDDMDDGLQLNKNSIVIKMGGASGTEVPAANYDIVKNDHDFTITLKDDTYIKGLATKVTGEGDNQTTVKTTDAERTLYVTYTAKLTGDAVHYNATDNNNKLTVTYSNNPNKVDDYEVDERETHQYTFEIDGQVSGYEHQGIHKTHELIKTDENGMSADEKQVFDDGTDTWDTAPHPLAGAIFELKMIKDDSNPAKTINNGKTYYAISGDDGLFKASTTVKYKDANNVDHDINGFKGLDAGTYELKEVKAPDGYSLDASTHTVVIHATYDQTNDGGKIGGKLTSYSITIDGNQNTYNATYSSTNPAQIKEISATLNTTPIINTKTPALPSTGGIGTYVFTVAGVAIMAIAAGLLIVRHKKKAE